MPLHRAQLPTQAGLGTKGSWLMGRIRAMTPSMPPGPQQGRAHDVCNTPCDLGPDNPQDKPLRPSSTQGPSHGRPLTLPCRAVRVTAPHTALHLTQAAWRRTSLYTGSFQCPIRGYVQTDLMVSRLELRTSRPTAWSLVVWPLQ